MIIGRVESGRAAHIDCLVRRIDGPGSWTADIRFVVDTGCTPRLFLNGPALGLLGITSHQYAQISAFKRIIGIDGRPVIVKLTSVYVRRFGAWLRVAAYTRWNAPRSLIGFPFLRGTRLDIDRDVVRWSRLPDAAVRESWWRRFVTIFIG